jgi:hypothetical protein
MSVSVLIRDFVVDAPSNTPTNSLINWAVSPPVGGRCAI